MKIAIPLSEGKLARHFGRATLFAFFDVDPARKIILHRQDISAPPHQPEFLPSWLAEQKVSLVIAGGMGQRAMQLLSQKNIHTVVGAEKKFPEALITHYFNGTIKTGKNDCSECFTVCVTNPSRR